VRQPILTREKRKIAGLGIREGGEIGGGKWLGGGGGGGAFLTEKIPGKGTSAGCPIWDFEEEVGPMVRG